MDFLNHIKGGMVFYQVFLLSPVLQCTIEIQKRLHEYEEICERLRELKEIEISRQSCIYVTVNSKEENSQNPDSGLCFFVSSAEDSQ